MKLTVDKRKTNIIYVDKVNLHSANNNDVLKLIHDNETNDIIDVYINLLAGTYNLNTVESKVLKHLFVNDKCKTSTICNNVSKDINKSNATIFRAIDKLRSKNLIYVDTNGYIIVSNTISVNDIDINNIKFIIIELNNKYL